jgi:hypothetical protein
MSTDVTTPTTPASPSSVLTGDLSAKQAETMIGWTKADLLSGKITAEKANDIFNQLGASEAQRAGDTRSTEEKQLDTQFPPAQPKEYQIRYGRPGEDVQETPELKAFDTNARTWMSTAGFPRETGNSLVNAIAKVSQQTQRMTEGELEAYGQKEYERLQRVHGEKLEERLQLAASMIHALDVKTPGLKNLLKSKGIGDNAMVASLLIQQAARYHARKGR